MLQRDCKIIYPGSEVPGWFSHRSMESNSITIQFPLNWDKFKGVVFCIIFEFRKPSEGLDIYEIGFKMDGVGLDNSGEVREDLWSHSYFELEWPNSDEVLIVYQRDNPFKEYSATLSSFQLYTNAVFGFSERYKNPEKYLKVKEWGVHLVQGQDDAESIIVSCFKTFHY